MGGEGSTPYQIQDGRPQAYGGGQTIQIRARLTPTRITVKVVSHASSWNCLPDD